MDKDIKDGVIILILITIASFFFGYWSSLQLSEDLFKRKGAMEVYRGNTKLEYTMVDSIVVDSCVIFLNNN